MKNKIKYTDEPMGELRIVKDFLPSPDQLVFKEENVKITISLRKSSVEFFKKEGREQGGVRSCNQASKNFISFYLFFPSLTPYNY